MESQETSAKSVDEAVEIALQSLGAKLSEVEIVILSEGRAGILGLGAEDARVRVTKLEIRRSRMSADFPPRPPVISYAPSAHTADRAAAHISTGMDVTDASKTGQEVLEALLDYLGVEAEVVETKPMQASSTDAQDAVSFDVRGPDLGILIGRKGQTLASLQYMTNLIVNKKSGSQTAVTVDVEGYKARRYESLRNLAMRMGDRVRTSGQTVTLEPMSAAERRIIHMALQDFQDITTQSVGEGESRKVSIILKRR